jgi:hypothetical protein
MEVAHGVANDLGALPEFTLRPKPELLHGVENAPVHWLQTIAHVGERPVHDGGQCISEVTLLERVSEIYRLNRARIRGRNSLSHIPRLTHRRARLKIAVGHLRSTEIISRLEFALPYMGEGSRKRLPSDKKSADSSEIGEEIEFGMDSFEYF